MLNIEEFSASYGQVRALHGLDLHVESGESVCILGSNGAGKSTLIKSVMGLGPQTAGRIAFAGEDLMACAVEDRVGRGLSVVFEGRGVLAGMTVHENLLMGAYSRDDDEIEDTLEDVAGMFPILATRRNQAAGTLSGGEQQMLVIARALMSRPKMIMLDEPSMGLAPIVVEQVFDTIAQINKRGVAILLVEQNMHMALTVAGRFYVLDRGTVALEGTVSHGELKSKAGQILREEEIESAYLGERS